MKQIYRKYFITIVFLSLFISSCQLLSINKINLNKYDGIYSVSFICGENCIATSIVNIKDGKIEEKIQNIYKQIFKVSGFVLSDGKLKLSISSTTKKNVKAYGSISIDGILEGTYSIDETRNCKFSGFLITKNPNEKITKYDGIYEIDFKRNGKLMARTKVKIKNGAFHTFIITKNKNIFKVNGKISYKGKILLNTIFSMNNGLTASGLISDEGSIKGRYYISDGINGHFSGKLIR